jgi:hypothetical protein
MLLLIEPPRIHDGTDAHEQSKQSHEPSDGEDDVM